MKGALEPKIVIVEHDGVTAIRQPDPSPTCGNPCPPGQGYPCDWCCYQRSKELLLSISRPEITTPAEEKEVASHEWN